MLSGIIGSESEEKLELDFHNGELLESLFSRWLIIRSYLCILTKQLTIPLADLLGKLCITF